MAGLHQLGGAPPLVDKTVVAAAMHRSRPPVAVVAVGQAVSEAQPEVLGLLGLLPVEAQVEAEEGVVVVLEPEVATGSIQVIMVTRIRGAVEPVAV